QAASHPAKLARLRPFVVGLEGAPVGPAHPPVGEGRLGHAALGHAELYELLLRAVGERAAVADAGPIDGNPQVAGEAVALDPDHLRLGVLGPVGVTDAASAE